MILTGAIASVFYFFTNENVLSDAIMCNFVSCIINNFSCFASRYTKVSSFWLALSKNSTNKLFDINCCISVYFRPVVIIKTHYVNLSVGREVFFTFELCRSIENNNSGIAQSSKLLYLFSMEIDWIIEGWTSGSLRHWRIHGEDFSREKVSCAIFSTFRRTSLIFPSNRCQKHFKHSQSHHHKPELSQVRIQSRINFYFNSKFHIKLLFTRVKGIDVVIERYAKFNVRLLHRLNKSQINSQSNK